MSPVEVLVVDDDREIVRAIELRLRKAGFETTAAFDGQQGLDIAQHSRPDVILMDLRMPVMDGFTMLKRLQNSVLTANIPAIILSADSAERARLQAMRGGATFFVEKPYRAKDLIEALHAAVKPSPRPEHTMRRPEHIAPTADEVEVEPNRRVLIADDDPGVVRALAVRCRKLGLEVETAVNGLQAILKAQRNPPRLLILDIKMPEADGFRVCEWLLDAKRPPAEVIILTGSDDVEALDRSDSLGAYYVHKDQNTWEAIRSVLAKVFAIDSAALKSVDARPSIAMRELDERKRNKILIVDDDTDLAHALARVLNKCGAQATTASNGVEAYHIAVRDRPDAIIADDVMPEGGGHYLLWRLKSTETTRHIPVIMITDQRLGSRRDRQSDREWSGSSGAVAVLRKPLDNDALFKELSHHCAIQYSPG